jgi:hypothetical protein
MEVYDAGHEGEAVCVHAFARRFAQCAYAGDPACTHADIGSYPGAAAAVVYRCAADQEVEHGFSGL